MKKAQTNEDIIDACVCGSGKSFALCCEPLLAGKSRAKTVRQLTRSRYAAYALGKYSGYLVKTWHPASAKNISIADLTATENRWTRLEIINHQQKGDMGQVEFKACYRQGDDGPEQVHHELSLFHRLKGEWLYLEGRILS